LFQRRHYLAQVLVERYLQGDLRDPVSAADRRVDDGIGGQLLVRDHESGAVEKADERVAEPDLLDDPPPTLELHAVAETTRLRESDQEAGDEVAEGPLGGESDDDPDHGRRGEETARDGAYLRHRQQRRE